MFLMKDLHQSSEKCQDDNMDLVYDWIINLKYEDIPGEVVDYARLLLLDVLGCIIGGSSQEGISKIAEFVREHGGSEDSYLPFYGGKYSAPMVGFALGPMARALDVGDVHMQGSHTSEFVAPTLLGALGLKEIVSGKDFMTSFIIGIEVLIRLGIASNWKDSIINKIYRGGHFIFGVVAGTAKMLSLDFQELKNAMGMAVAKVQPHHTSLVLGRPSHLVRLKHAFIAQDAITVCLLARKGLTGPPNIMSEDEGYLSGFPKEMIHPEAISANLGKKWNILDTCMKAYPSCRCSHTAIEVLLTLMKDCQLNPADIAKIHVRESSFNSRIVCSTPEKVYNPRTVPESQFSLAYILAVAALTGEIWVDSYSEEMRSRTDIRNFMKKVTYEEGQDLPDVACELTITMNNGPTYHKKLIHPKGDRTNNPISKEEVITKFRRLTTYSILPLREQIVNELINSVMQIADVTDVQEKIVLPLLPN
jgi:2-methylcitrate dehydratase PrpD